MSEISKETHAQIEVLRKLAFDMTPAAQYRLASFVAENVGYVLQREGDHPDSPHDDAPAAPSPGSEAYVDSLQRLHGITAKYGCLAGEDVFEFLERRLGERSAAMTEWEDVAEDDPDVVIAARAIAEHGVGRPWDDFEPVNAYDIDQSDLIEYGRAAVAALRAAQDDFLRNLVDWTHLYAFSGESWLSHKTASVLIACARKKKVTQEDADVLKACPSIYPYAEHLGIDLIALARNDRQTGGPRS